MEKICLIGDAHFSRKAEHPLIKKHIKDGQLAFFDYLVNELNIRGVKTILFTGDIHDTRQSINVESLVNTKRLLQTKLKDFDVHIILGNHDMYFENDYDITALELFEDIPNVTIYRDGVVIKEFLKRKWYMFPWIIHEREENVIKFLQKLSNNPPEKRHNTVLFGHFELFGINMEGNSMSTFGLDPNLFMNAADYIFSGHYHGVSLTEKSSSKLHYLGSPYPMTFANANQEHGVWILDEQMNVEFIENTISPRFVEIWDTDDLDAIKDLSNCFVRLFVCNDNSKEQDFEIRLKVESKKPILVRHLPYNGSKKEIIEKTENEREANQIMKMDTLDLSKIYLDQNTDDLPCLKLTNDVYTAVLKEIERYSETINV